MLAGSRDAQEAFVRNLFHAVVKQPMRAWGADTLESLRTSFAANDCDVRRLLVDIMAVAALPPPAAPQTPPPAPAPPSAEKSP
jgi:hypothetical protein